MIITTEKNLNNFEFWAGAKNLASKLTFTELTEITHQLEELHPDGMKETQINDLFWFEQDFICEIIGLKTEDVLNR